MPKWKQRAASLARGALALVLMLGLLAAYAGFTERRAAEQAQAFCAAAALGMAVPGLRAQALAQGAHAGQTRWSPQADGSEQLWATFTGVFPLSRHICLVTARAGQVVEARLAYLD